MRSYETARSLFGFLEFCSWIVVIGGVLLSIYSFQFIDWNYPAGGLTILMLGVLMTFIGVLGAAGVQMGRATVDTAEFGQQALSVARNQLEVSKQGLRAQLDGLGISSYDDLKSKTVELPSFDHAVEIKKDAGTQKPNVAAPPVGQSAWHNGQEIRAVEAGYVVGGTVFAEFGQATAKADALEGIPAIKGEFVEQTTDASSDTREGEFSYSLLASDTPSEEPAEIGIGASADQEVLTYRGNRIVQKDGRFFLGTRGFETLEGVHRFVDGT